MEETCKALIGNAQTDKELVEPEVKETVDRYDKLSFACAQKQKELDDIQQSLTVYKNTLSPVEELVSNTEQALALQEPVIGDLKKNKDDLEKVKVLLYIFNNLKTVALLTVLNG